MASIVAKKRNGKSYFCKVESYREGGKVKQRVLEYYGTKDPRKDKHAKPIIKSSVSATYRFGDAALLYRAAQAIDMIDTVDMFVPKRQGLSLGLELFLTVAHRILDDKPSSANLSRWVGTTHLPLLLNFESKRLTNNTQQYLMDKLYDHDRNIDHLLRISKELYENALPLFGKEDKTFFYDVTSTYFEGDCCPIAKLGYSRDDAVDKLQINIGMVVNGSYGIPLMTKVFEGNINDVKTVIEMVYYAQFVLGKKKGLLIMDRGMDSEENIHIIDGVGYDHIIGLRSNHDFVEELKLETDASTNDWDIFKAGEQQIKIKRFTKNLFGKRRQVILYYNEGIAAQQKERREERIQNASAALKKEKGLTKEKAQKIINGAKSYFVLEDTAEGIKWRVDQVECNRAERRNGKFCLLTNLELDAKEIFRLYFSKDKIEKGFRHMKQDVALHPTRKRLADRVRVDVFVCHLGYLLLRVAEHLAQQKINGIFWDELTSESKEIRLLELQDRSENRRFQIVSNNETQKNIVDKLGLSKQVPLPLRKAK